MVTLFILTFAVCRKRDSKSLYYRSSYLQVILHTGCLTGGEAIICTCPSFKPFKATLFETLSIGFTLPLELAMPRCK